MATTRNASRWPVRRTRGRARRSLSQLWQVPTFFVGLLVFLGVAFSATTRDRLHIQLAKAVTALQHALETGKDLDTAQARVESLTATITEPSRPLGHAHFLLGSIGFKKSQDADARARTIAHLESALVMGVSDEDLLHLKYRLGSCLAQQKTDMPRAVRLLQESLPRGADQPAQGYALLVQAYLDMPEPNFDAALLATRKQLEHADMRDPIQAARVRYLRGDILARREQWADALKEFDLITGKVPRELLHKVRLRQAQCAEEEGLWLRAIAAWKDALNDGPAPRVLYALANALTQLDPPNYEEAADYWRAAMSEAGEEGQASALRLGEAHLFGTQYDADRALSVWERALRDVRQPSEFNNTLVPLSRAREMLEMGCRHFLDRRDFERTEKLAELYKKIALPGVSEEKIALAAEGLGKELLKKANALDGPAASAEKANARTQFHKSALAFEQAARDRETEAPADLLWRSAQCYMSAENYLQASAMLERVIKLETNELRLAEAWLLKAEAHAAQGARSLARQAFEKCIEFPATPFAFRARYQLALIAKQEKRLDDAREILHQNLTAPGAQRDRDAIEKSHFEIINVLLAMSLKDQAFEQAISYMKQALQLYPNHAHALKVREQLGDAYRTLAEQEGRKLKDMQSIGAAPEVQRAQRNWQRLSQEQFLKLCAELEALTSRRELRPDELMQLRKSLFAAAESFFEQGDYAESLQRYVELQRRYPNQIESLIACHRLFRCMGVMVQSREQMTQVRDAAKRALERARADLEKIAEDNDSFKGEGVWTKRIWQSWLEWAEGELKKPLPS